MTQVIDTKYFFVFYGGHLSEGIAAVCPHLSGAFQDLPDSISVVQSVESGVELIERQLVSQ